MSPAEQEPSYETDDTLADAFDGFDEWLDKLRHGGPSQKDVAASIPAGNGVLLAAINSCGRRTRRVAASVSPEMRAALEELAYDNAVTVADIVYWAVLDHLVKLHRTHCPDPHDELGRLRGVMQYCVEGPTDASEIKRELRDALKGR